MFLFRIPWSTLIAATFLALGFTGQTVHGQEPPVWDLSDHRVPIGQEMGEQLFFDLNRNDFYGDAALTNKVIILNWSITSRTILPKPAAQRVLLPLTPLLRLQPKLL